MKKILITGLCGFIGAHIIEHILKTTDWEIVGIDRLSYASTGFDRIKDIEAFDNKRFKLFTADFTKPIREYLAEEIGEVDYILHMGAQTHVDNSIKDPKSFVEANVIGTFEMLEYARRLKGLKKFIYFSTDEVYGPAPKDYEYKEGDRFNPGNPYAATKASAECLCMAYANTYSMPIIITNCWDMDTKVLTEKGSKSYSELEEGDLVWTLDKNEQLILEPVQKKIKMKGSDIMYRFTTNTMSQLVTPNHRVMLKKSKGKPRRWGDIEESHAEDLFNKPNRIRIPLTGKWVGDDSYFPKGFNKVWLAKVLGWYVSEGFEADGNGICFGSGTEWQFKELETLLKDYKPKRNGRSVRVYNKELKSILKSCGRLAMNKKVPRFVLQGTTKTLKPFWECAMKGDGANLGIKGQEVYYTISKQLVDDFREIGMKLGYGIRISERETWNPKKTKKSKSFIVRFHKGFTDLERRNIQKESYSGDVWCVSVPSGRVFIEREGTICLTGQTMNVYGERQHPEKFIPLVINKVLKGEKVLIHANKDKTKAGSRFWIHGRNVASAILYILNNTNEELDTHDAEKGKFNIVGEKEVDNLEMAQFIAKTLDKELIYEMVDFHSSRPGHDLRYGLNGDKMKGLGWTPSKTFEESLSKTIKWTVNNKKWLEVIKYKEQK